MVKVKQLGNANDKFYDKKSGVKNDSPKIAVGGRSEKVGIITEH